MRALWFAAASPDTHALNLFVFLPAGGAAAQVRVDKANNDSDVFNGVVGALSLSIFVVPPLNKIIAALSEDVDSGF
jgi:hypothetical protein